MLKPLNERVLVTMEKDEVVDNGHGIFVPTKAAQRAFMKKQGVQTIDADFTNHIRFGQVKAIAKEVKKVKVGDWVVINRHNGDEFEFDGQPYIALKEEWIIATFEK